MESYRLTMLGVRGSGKTVYLTMLKKYFDSIPALGGNIDVKVIPPEAAAELDRKYYGLVDTPEWPLPTDPADFPEWRFRCSVVYDNEEFPMLDVVLRDFAGELLESSPGRSLELDQRAAAMLDGGDATLLLIDGEEVRKLLGIKIDDDQRIDEATFIDQQVKPMLPYARHSSYALHIVITKWDVLDSVGVDLARVRERFEEMKWFRDLVALKKQQKALVRLIPVSSLRDFADLGADGEMYKRMGREPVPLNVQIPFVTVVPEFLRRLNPVAERAVEHAIAAGNTEPTLDQLAEFVFTAPNAKQAAVGLSLAGSAGIVRLGKRTKQALRRGGIPVKVFTARWREPSPKRVKDSLSAYGFLMAMLIWHLRAFERRERASSLAK